MSPTVDALLPLSLLEAVRDVDTPEGEFDAELVAELKNKRLGLSDTVYSQIRRYAEAVKRNQRAGQEEAAALARLIGRRPDAANVFRAAGRHLARQAYVSLSPVTRQLIRGLPSFLARPVALRRARRIVDRYLDATLERTGSHLLLEVSRPVTLETTPRGAGCAFYEACLRELILLFIGGTGAVEHVCCRTRGEESCQWRIDWRPVDRAALPPE